MNVKHTYEKFKGLYEYYFKPRYQNLFGGPFNGQEYRKSIYLELVESCKFNYLVETGGCRADTTIFLAESNLPVYSVELVTRYFSYSQARTKNKANIHLFQNDSRKFLSEIAENKNLEHKNVFFYLDAHWEEDLPLEEELFIIFNNWQDAVVMIDDFKVPGTEYGYDDYGENKTLNLNYLNKIISMFNLRVYFPKDGPEKETGSKRGCVILTNYNKLAAGLDNQENLYLYN